MTINTIFAVPMDNVIAIHTATNVDNAVVALAQTSGAGRAVADNADAVITSVNSMPLVITPQGGVTCAVGFPVAEEGNEIIVVVRDLMMTEHRILMSDNETFDDLRLSYTRRSGLESNNFYFMFKNRSFHMGLFGVEDGSIVTAHPERHVIDRVALTSEPAGNAVFPTICRGPDALHLDDDRITVTIRDLVGNDDCFLVEPQSSFDELADKFALRTTLTFADVRFVLPSGLELNDEDISETYNSLEELDIFHGALIHTILKPQMTEVDVRRYLLTHVDID